MTSSSAVDVAIGLSFIFFLFSVLVSKVNEVIAGALNLRHKGVQKALRALFGFDATALSSDLVLEHNLVQNLQTASKSDVLDRVRKALRRTEKGLSYLPARTVSAAVLDVLAPATHPADVFDAISGTGTLRAPVQAALTEARRHPDLDTLRALQAALTEADAGYGELSALIEEFQHAPLERAYVTVAALPKTNPARTPLLRMLADSRGDVDRFRASLEHWYDDAMDRVSGWYKRYVQRIILGLSLAVVVFFNVDTVNLAQILWRVPTDRAAIATAAGNEVQQGKANSLSVDAQLRKISSLNLPLGWSAGKAKSDTKAAASVDPRRFPADVRAWAIKLVGLSLSVLALSLGAPFWFDALNKVAQLRQSGPRAERSKA